MDRNELAIEVRLRIYESVPQFGGRYECPSLWSDSLINSMANAITERDGKFYDENNELIENLPAYAAQRAKWRALAKVSKQRKKPSSADGRQALPKGDGGLAIGTTPLSRLGIDVSAEVVRLEKGECNDRAGVTLRRTQRIGHVLRMVILEGKSYDHVHKELGVSKGSVANDVEMGKLYLRTLSRKLGRTK